MANNRRTGSAVYQYFDIFAEYIVNMDTGDILSGLAIRPIRDGEIHLLKDFLYEAIFVPEGVAAPPKDVIDIPQLRVYIEDFGQRKDDCCLVAEYEGKVTGAVWTRIMNDYGHVDDNTPSLSVSLYPGYRHRGIGTLLMKEMIAWLGSKGYAQVSLSVQKANYAVGLYKRLGFVTVRETEEEYVMVKRLCGGCEVRPVRENDIPELRELFRSTVLSVNIRDYTREEAEDWASCGDSIGHWRELLSENTFIAAIDVCGKIIGFSSMNANGHLHSMFVHKDWQNKRVATVLLSEVENLAAKYGVAEIISEVSITARPFFEKRGYEVVKTQKRRANRLELTNFVMRKRMV